PAGQADHRAVVDARRGLLTDAPLLLLPARRLVPEGELVGDHLRDGPAVRAGEQALLLERLEVAADRGPRDAQDPAEGGDRHRAARRQLLEDHPDALGLAHGSEYRGPLRA